MLASVLPLGKATRFLPLACRSFSVSYKLSQVSSGDARTQTNRLEKTLNRFWKNAQTKENPQTKLYEVCLDDKPLKTPLGHTLAIPAEKKQLAHLVEHEWDTLNDLKIKPNSLPLTSMVSRAVDLQTVHFAEEVDANMVAKIGDLNDIKYNMLRYLDTDTCLIFTVAEEYEGRLRAKQEELYRPLIAEYEDFFTAYGKKHNLLPDENARIHLEVLDCETDGLCGKSQSITTQNVVLKWLDLLPIYDLVALEKAILSSKSFLCGASILRSNVGDEDAQKNLYQVNKSDVSDYFYKSVDEIMELGNLETIFQTGEWGEVEDTHDVDNADWLRNLSSSALVCH
ncbi:hypothetical protein PUMCH_000458 [Australozyma saopauloensis]|uniref:Uncharacterized protein n=1 Tax=Australozyma saopauloensis TaxID=291208 RepID=A0AAX4H4U7_9ASCO|nr:hypothetical protein PUMCH_000458 [[Candida] saopauloensis]